MGWGDIYSERAGDAIRGMWRARRWIWEARAVGIGLRGRDPWEGPTGQSEREVFPSGCPLILFFFALEMEETGFSGAVRGKRLRVR